MCQQLDLTEMRKNGLEEEEASGRNKRLVEEDIE